MKTYPTETVVETLRTALGAANGITLLRNVLEDATAQTVLAFMRELAAYEPDALQVAVTYNAALYALATAANAQETIPGLSDAWQAYLVTRILDDVNPWSMQAERTHTLAPGLREQAKRDLRALRLLFDLPAQSLWQAAQKLVAAELPALQDAWVPWLGLTAHSNEQEPPTARDLLGHTLAESEDWTGLVGRLTAHWGQYGTGLFARYHMLRWLGREEGLVGITHPDPVQLQSLVGYEREQNILKANTERFLAGLPAHDAVLYGAPGTGKSSTVKALANAYANRGLRLIEVRKDYINDLPQIAAQLRGRAPHFLLFIDDLSFEEHETEYKALKVLLEGVAEMRPANMLIYATTNRLNLIREQFSDRGKPTEDVNWRDTMDEKVSLVARFGLRVTFALPGQEQYLKIVTALARQRGIALPEDELRARALAWERQHANRSGRAARQFIDGL